MDKEKINQDWEFSSFEQPYDFVCECLNQETVLREYNQDWGEGEVWCRNCNHFVRFWDSG